MAATTPGQSDAGLAALIDQCVMCGLCLPHCPTYRLERHEAESPRGRIALARHLLKGELATPETAFAHVDHCLGCMACEAVCPSQVRYGEILVATRARIAAQRETSTGFGISHWPARRLRRLARLAVLTRAARWLPKLAGWLPLGARWRRVLAELPAAPPKLEARAPTRMPDRGRVVLFPGCVADAFDRDSLEAARLILQALGYEVVMPAQAVCCSAIARHAGALGPAEEIAASTRAALEPWADAPVLVAASGCLGSLRDHVFAETRSRVRDVLDFISVDAELPSLRFRSCSARVAVHLPCTQRNVIGNTGTVLALLGRVPGLDAVRVADSAGCCGAAGTGFIDNPAQADALRDATLAAVEACHAELLVTTNVGCRIFLGNGLRRRATGVPVLHPLALLARQLDTAAP